MEKVLGYVEKHFREQVRISDLARMAGVSTATFSRRFKKMTGTGLEDYLQTRRIEEAKFLLKIGNLSGTRIGQDCGFKSKSHFVDLFKKKTGLTPQKYREKFQKA
jgi:transcriptional regulator GlxA family with amidase domain